MTESPATRAAAAATTTLLLGVIALGSLIYLATEVEAARPLYFLLAALTLAVTFVLHAVFVGLLARREGRRAMPYVVGAVLTFPLGSAIGLILYEWRTRVDAGSPERTA